MKIHRTVYQHRVTFADCDPAQMAYYPRMLEWLDRSTDHLFRSVGLCWEEMFPRNEPQGMPMLDISIQFKYPCRFGDRISIESWVEAFEGRKFTIKHEMKNGENLAAECREHRAWVVLDPGSARGIKAIPVPDEVRKLFHRPG
ncbi:MAG: acyl-CoA thioesterase [Rhodospirillaceae bacterium]|nr:acyl-CoA thioesterase [Rhodospirillaceae bacterium]